MDSSEHDQAHNGDEFLRQAAGESPGLLREYLDFFRTHRKWWLAPIVLGLLMVGVVVVVGGTAVAPLIYALF